MITLNFRNGPGKDLKFLLFVVSICALCLLAAECSGQRITKQELWVTTVHKDTVTHEKKVVYLGTMDDQLCVNIDYMMCFDSVRIKRIVTDDMIDNNAVGVNAIGEKHQIRQVIGTDGFIFWIIN